MVEENRDYEEGDVRRFCSVFVNRILTKFIVDIL